MVSASSILINVNESFVKPPVCFWEAVAAAEVKERVRLYTPTYDHDDQSEFPCNVTSLLEQQFLFLIVFYLTLVL